MSRSATPARFSAASTRLIRSAESWIAPLAVAERETTPAVMIATSGTLVTSPTAVTSSRVPAIVCVMAGRSCAMAGANGAADASASAPSRRYFIDCSSLLMTSSGLRPRHGCLLNGRSLHPPAARDQPVNDEQDDRADDRGDEARALAGLVPADRVADPSGDQRSRNPQKDGNDAAARVSPRHQQLGDEARDSADDDP